MDHRDFYALAQENEKTRRRQSFKGARIAEENKRRRRRQSAIVLIVFFLLYAYGIFTRCYM